MPEAVGSLQKLVRPHTSGAKMMEVHHKFIEMMALLEDVCGQGLGGTQEGQVRSEAGDVLAP